MVTSTQPKGGDVTLQRLTPPEQVTGKNPKSMTRE
ncbi:hypothetical protein Tco_1322597, partial [Tanacetum coccineum]